MAKLTQILHYCGRLILAVLIIPLHCFVLKVSSVAIDLKRRFAYVLKQGLLLKEVCSKSTWTVQKYRQTAIF